MSDALHPKDRFIEDLLAEAPRLRGFAIAMTGSQCAGDDLVQDTIVKALRHRDSFHPGTNFRGWLFTIQRNLFFSQSRRAGRMVQDVDGVRAAKLVASDNADWRLRYSELLRAMQLLPVEQREALTLVVSGASYEEVAEVMGCAEGTVKSRVNRARQFLDRHTNHTDPTPEARPRISADAEPRFSAAWA